MPDVLNEGPATPEPVFYVVAWEHEGTKERMWAVFSAYIAAMLFNHAGLGDVDFTIHKATYQDVKNLAEKHPDADKFWPTPGTQEQ